MSRSKRTLRVMVAAAWVALAGGGVAKAQGPAQSTGFAGRGAYSAPIPPGAGSPYGVPYANPFVNPAMNPYLNPYLSTTSMSSDAALLMLLQAQRASGGIGSGVPSGLRQAQQPKQKQVQTAATMPRSVSQPGEGAEKYFSRSPANPGSVGSRYFNRGQGRFDR